jgi:hypothetical protein
VLPSMKNLRNDKGGLIQSMVNIAGDEVGGFNNLGITLNDNHNYLYTWMLVVITEIQWMMFRFGKCVVQ